MALLFVGVLMGALDLAIIGPALPAIQSEFGLDNRQLSWLFNVYVLAQLPGTPLLAKMSDRFGRRDVYIACVAAFDAGEERSLRQIVGVVRDPIAIAIRQNGNAIDDQGARSDRVTNSGGVVFVQIPSHGEVLADPAVGTARGALRRRIDHGVLAIDGRLAFAAGRDRHQHRATCPNPGGLSERYHCEIAYNRGKPHYRISRYCVRATSRRR